MGFKVEDGTGLVDATSYVSVEDANAYFADRAMTGFPSDPTAAQAALIRATDYIDRRFQGAFIGSYLNVEDDSDGDPTIVLQALEWPRITVCGQVAPIPLPPQLIKACCEYAFRAAVSSLAPDPTVDPSGYQVVSTLKKVGPIQTSTKFNDKMSQMLLRPYPLADMLLRPLLIGGGTQGRVIRN